MNSAKPDEKSSKEDEKSVIVYDPTEPDEIALWLLLDQELSEDHDEYEPLLS